MLASSPVYRLVAGALALVDDSPEKSDCVRVLAVAFGADNPRFDRQKFMAACRSTNPTRIEQPTLFDD